MNLNSPQRGSLLFGVSPEHTLSVLPMGGPSVVGPDRSAPIARIQKSRLGERTGRQKTQLFG